jgi:hypothetical protein
MNNSYSVTLVSINDLTVYGVFYFTLPDSEARHHICNVKANLNGVCSYAVLNGNNFINRQIWGDFDIDPTEVEVIKLDELGDAILKVLLPKKREIFSKIEDSGEIFNINIK